MICVDTDQAKQLLMIRFEQTVTVEEAEAAVERVKRCLQELRAGFCLLADLCDLVSMEDECAPFIMQVMNFCAEKGIGKVYRVMPDPTKDIGFNIMSAFHYGHGIRVVIFENREQAEEAVERLGRHATE